MNIVEKLDLFFVQQLYGGDTTAPTKAVDWQEVLDDLFLLRAPSRELKASFFDYDGAYRLTSSAATDYKNKGILNIPCLVTGVKRTVPKIDDKGVEEELVVTAYSRLKTAADIINSFIGVHGRYFHKIKKLWLSFQAEQFNSELFKKVKPIMANPSFSASSFNIVPNLLTKDLYSNLEITEFVTVEASSSRYQYDAYKDESTYALVLTSSGSLYNASRAPIVPIISDLRNRDIGLTSLSTIEQINDHIGIMAKVITFNTFALREINAKFQGIY